MLKAMDRVVMVAPDAATVGMQWEKLLDARAAGSAPRPALGARAHYWRVGDGWLEVLIPEGDGLTARVLQERGAHLFAGGFTTTDVEALDRHLRELGVVAVRDEERLVLEESATGIRGLRLVVGPDDPQPVVGLLDTFYELTDLVADADRETARVAEVLGLDASAFESITSPQYGYRGTLTLFDRERLDRLEIITPERQGTTMRRFFERIGGGLYMAFAETGLLEEIERRAIEKGVGHTAVPPPATRETSGAHTVFLHPAALGGMMLGVSRRTYAWTWSGHPDRVSAF